MRPNESTPFYVEQTGYQKTMDLAIFNAALKNITPYADSPRAASMRKDPWGQKGEHIDLQYRKFVPVQDVPDQYSLESTGQSGKLSQSVIDVMYTDSDRKRFVEEAEANSKTAEAGPGTGAAPAAKKAKRYKKKTDDLNMASWCIAQNKGEFPNKAATKKVLAAFIGIKFKNLQGHLNRLKAGNVNWPNPPAPIN
jgi:hypothetical protein